MTPMRVTTGMMRVMNGASRHLSTLPSMRVDCRAWGVKPKLSFDFGSKIAHDFFQRVVLRGVEKPPGARAARGHPDHGRASCPKSHDVQH